MNDVYTSIIQKKSIFWQDNMSILLFYSRYNGFLQKGPFTNYVDKILAFFDHLKVSFFQKDLLISLDSPKKRTNEFVFSTQMAFRAAKRR